MATGFPSGQYPLSTRLQEIKFALDNGATEIDVVIDRSLVLMGEWETLYDELLQMRRVCGRAHLKVILGVGELGSYENVCTYILTFNHVAFTNCFCQLMFNQINCYFSHLLIIHSQICVYYLSSQPRI